MKHSALPIEPAPAIPDDNAPLPPARPGTRWTVRRGRTIAFVLVGLALAVSLLSVFATYQVAEESGARAVAVEQRLAVLEQDLAERRDQRDQERDALAARVDEFVAYLCSALSQQPAGQPTLDELRRVLGCTEPGITPAPPLSPSSALPTPGAATVTPRPSAGAPAVDGATGTRPPAEAPVTSPAPPAAPSTTAPAPAPAAPTAPPERGLLGSVLCALPILC